MHTTHKSVLSAWQPDPRLNFSANHKRDHHLQRQKKYRYICCGTWTIPLVAKKPFYKNYQSKRTRERERELEGRQEMPTTGSGVLDNPSVPWGCRNASLMAEPCCIRGLMHPFHGYILSLSKDQFIIISILILIYFFSSSSS